ncbi:aminotransferase class I/II-fold pyridoxal phosphate-dependent enzyme [Kiloniella sp. EL199]|uniref:aminotransferase class I/II-fold pyridoxal phosphate-dependent enzyme n=1 Tax=Kiloniella sp. EL199 TaxID=2107581 RepID=UPI001C1FEB0E|nr:aminotransferase class I/II-fold pyridoxal phosphate-dependent enzyme [Kiloniella sp. EL199]
MNDEICQNSLPQNSLPKNSLPEKPADLMPDTLLAHDPAWAENAMAPPIVQSSLFTFKSYDEMVTRFKGESDSNIYSRISNPTVRAFEEKMALLEKGDEALAFASGMAAISAAVLAHVESGDRILCVRHVYPDAYRLFQGFMPRYGVHTDYVDGTDLAEIEAKLPDVKVLYLESPTTMTFEIQDLAAIAKLAKAHGVTTIIDNSYATPINQTPLTHGIDIVVHSASKYISGHSDTVAGILVAKKEIVDHIRNVVVPYMGGKLGPFEAWLLLRGMRTLAIRMARHAQSAQILIDDLKTHPAVRKVLTANYEQSNSLKASSGLFSIDLDPQINIPRFVDNLKLFHLGVSWGGYESLVIPAKASLEQAGAHTSMRDFGIPETMVRLNIGLEDVHDLKADLRSALRLADERTI